MYEFRDVTETSEGKSLPSEALKINGEFIENQIEGYRTLNVTGREALSPEVDFFETGSRDGSTLKGKRYPARIIRITYQLIAGTNEAFREAYNKLASILNVTDAELIFNDETDKFYTGTPSAIGEVPPGRNSVVGEFEILCLDPFKYSVMEYEAVSDLSEPSILLDYNGTYKSFPTLQAEFYKEDEASEDGETVTELTGKGSCGYVAFFNEDEKIIQIGDPDEADREITYAQSQQLISQDFKKSSSWGSAAKSLWAINSGITSSSAVEQAGNVSMDVASYSAASFKRGKAVVFQGVSTVGRPYVHYKVTMETVERSSTSATIQASVYAWLDNADSYLGKGYDLWIVLNHGKSANFKRLKSEEEEWRTAAVHSFYFKFRLGSLTEASTTLSSITFRTLRYKSTSDVGIIDETACKNYTISEYIPAAPSSYYLKAADYGSGSNWHGPSITRTIPADAAGDVGAVNFELAYSHKMSIGSGSNATAQLGAFQVLLVSGSGTSRKIVAGVNVYKGSDGKTANLRFYVNNQVKETIKIDLSYNNKTINTHTSYITKSGKTVEFLVAGIKKVYNDPDIATTTVKEVTFTFTAFGTKPRLEHNGLASVRFRKDNCDVWKDIPNKFSANDVIEADCKNGEILLNGVSAATYGALGNDWEDFYLKPGLNQIGFSYSDWVEADYAPTFKVKYREVFL